MIKIKNRRRELTHFFTFSYEYKKMSRPDNGKMLKLIVHSSLLSSVIPIFTKATLLEKPLRKFYIKQRQNYFSLQKWEITVQCDQNWHLKLPKFLPKVATAVL